MQSRSGYYSSQQETSKLGDQLLQGCLCGIGSKEYIYIYIYINGLKGVKQFVVSQIACKYKIQLHY